MSSQPPVENNPPDFAALTAEVKDQVEGKRAQGVYSPAEESRVAEMEVEYVFPKKDGAEAEVRLHLAKLEELWDSKLCGVQTHRPGTTGKLLLKAKSLFHKMTRAAANIWLARQVLFNDEVTRLLTLMVTLLNDQRYRQSQIEARLSAHDQNLAQHGRRFEEVKRHGDARVASLEREAGKGHTQMEQTLARLQDLLKEQAQAGLAPAEAVQAVSRERSRLRAGSYLAFEDMHRGSREEIKKSQEVYLPIFQDPLTPDKPILDLGCGRGEFLELARERGLQAKGVDLNPEMAAYCRGLGLEVVEGDALKYLQKLPDESLGGILAAQLIEHLDLEELTGLVSLCAAKLAPGGALVAETINPQCLTTFGGAFYMDLTHVKPIHPEAARFLWHWAGMAQVDIMYLSPYPEGHCLESFNSRGEEWVDALNRNMQRLNQLLFSFQDYAVVGRK